MNSLFTNFKIGNVSLKNRIVMPPMCMYSSNSDGIVQNFHLVHYGTRAQGGVGLIIVEATAVEPRGRISGNDLGIWNDDHVEGLKKLVEFVHSFGAKIALQLAHSGRKSEVGKGISSWNLRYSENYPEPEKMTKNDIEKVIGAFGESAIRAKKAGFDMVEIHGAHGYLINQFLTPLINKRTDLYGCQQGFGIKFLQEIIREVKKNFNNPISLRISAEDFEEDGLKAKDYVKIVSLLIKGKNTKIDLLNVSSGGVTHYRPKIEIIQGYQVQFAELLKKELDIPILTGGLLSDFEFVQNILTENKVDLIWLGRELLRNPYWPLKAAEFFEQEIKKPVQYKRSQPFLRK